MMVFTYSQARQNFSTVLDMAKREGSVLIKRRGGQLFSLNPVKKTKSSPFNIKGIKTRVTTPDIIEAIMESRSR